MSTIRFFLMLSLTMANAQFASAQLKVVMPNPKGQEIVVFLHGMGGDSKSTWTNDNGYYFPKGLSEDKELSSFVVATFDYPSGCDNVTPTEAATRLHEELQGLGQEYKSIHLIGHSLGGIVIRQFLLSFPNERYGSIQVFGTPNLGSSLERVADEICGRFLRKARSPVLDKRRGQYLDTLNDRWRSTFEQNDGKKKFVIHAAFEEPQGWSPEIVDKEAALLFSSRMNYFETDHVGIVKPSYEGDSIIYG